MNQHAPDLFSFAEGARKRDRGMSLATVAQEFTSPGYGDRLYNAILSVAMSKELFFVDDVTAIFSEKPSHPNSAGGAWRRAINDGVIERTGRLITSARISCRAHNYPQYRSKIFNK